MKENKIIDNLYLRRRTLLPIVIKIFILFFIIFGIIAILTLVLGFFDFRIPMAIYGLQTNNPISLTGIILILIFILKGIVAYSLWIEKKWAILVAIIDCYIGIFICVVTTIMIARIDVNSFPIRPVILLIIPYLIWLYNVKSK